MQQFIYHLQKKEGNKMKLKNSFAYYAKIATNQLGWVGGQIEVTTKCFQRCRGCVSWAQEKVEWSLGQLINVYQQLDNIVTFEHLTLTGGDPQSWEPLDDFIQWRLQTYGINPKIKLQINTAMTQDIKDMALWRIGVNDFKVSMDACTESTFKRIRGDNKRTPQGIMNRCIILKHESLAFNVTVYPENQSELVQLIQWVNDHYQAGMPIRKIMITAGIGDLKGLQNESFWNKWRNDKQTILQQSNITVPTSFHEEFDEDGEMVRQVCNQKKLDTVHCWASIIGFHIKADGALYPCCIAGGEVSATEKEYEIGNVKIDTLQYLYNGIKPTLRYKTKKYCRENCMYKQLQINIISEQANKITLALP